MAQSRSSPNTLLNLSPSTLNSHGVYLAFLRLDEALAFLDGLPPPPSSELAGFDHSPFDALIAWLTTICARSSEGSIFLVCPFLDAIEEDREQAAVTDALRRISDTIATRLGQLQHPARPRLVHNGGLVIWPLNNADAASNRAEPMQALLAELTTHWRQSPAANQLVPLPTVLLIDRLRLWAVEYDRSLASLSDVVDLFHSTIDSATLEFEICDMLDYLHQLGLVTFFREHPELRKVVVLDQRWLLDQMTRVIRKPAMHRLTDDSGGDLDTALLMSHPDEWADLYHSCTSDCGPGCAKGGRLHPSLLFALLPDFSEAECRQHLALMIKVGGVLGPLHFLQATLTLLSTQFGLAVAVGTPEAELYIVPPLLPRSRPNAPHPPPSPCAPLALALHFRSDICGSSLDFVNGADLRDRNHLPLGLLEQVGGWWEMRPLLLQLISYPSPFTPAPCCILASGRGALRFNKRGSTLPQPLLALDDSLAHCVFCRPRAHLGPGQGRGHHHAAAGVRACIC